jgi:hypothetical protein
MTGSSIMQAAKKEILPDFFFRFTSDANDADLSRLKASIRVSGIRTPLWVLRSGDGFTLCSGFRRFLAAGELGLETVPVQIPPGGKPSPEWLYGVLAEHISIQPLTLVEKARVLRLVQILVPGAETENGTGPFLDLLEIPRTPAAQVELLGVLDLHADASGYIEKHGMPIRSAKRFFLFSKEAQGWLAGIGLGLSIRPVELFEIGSSLRDISMRGNRTLSEEILALGLEGLLNDAQKNRNQKIESLKSILACKRQPMRTSLNEKLEGLEKNAGTPAGVRLTWDHSLETPGVRLEADIRDKGALERLAVWIADPSKRRAVEDMLQAELTAAAAVEGDTKAH